MPWRTTRDPYKILVSEVMLQQTQVSRVLVKYAEFLKRFPTIKKLAAAPLSNVLSVWQGLGYNRRALMLHKAARIVVDEFDGVLPSSIDELLSLPGVGLSTAAGILNFAYNIPTVYLETNVRSVYLHFFFPNRKNVKDKEIIPIIERTMPRQTKRAKPRSEPAGSTIGEWFYALLDYGVLLKQKHGNPNRRSAHYAKQSKFEGSTRQVRAKALREALKSGAAEKHLLKLLG